MPVSCEGFGMDNQLGPPHGIRSEISAWHLPNLASDEMEGDFNFTIVHLTEFCRTGTLNLAAQV